MVMECNSYIGDLEERESYSGEGERRSVKQIKDLNIFMMMSTNSTSECNQSSRWEVDKQSCKCSLQTLFFVLIFCDLVS
ncbi:hypothetical protein BRARA_B02924 [Brassica rapa]|uniref:Uncharacterized protein n=1 Tax=Brassica campestris TaxID=3711 RepID=A0A398ADN4_BRACM|nr:hypothetical protein BRARA_B02924 [Brassica rapa]